MSRPRITFLAALLTILLGIGASVACFKNGLRNEEPRVTIPNEDWVRVYFEAQGLASKSIDELTDEAHLPRLRTTKLPDSDLEVRVWVGFGVYGVDGLILRKSSHQWSAIHLHGMAEKPPFPNSKESLAPPKSGWETAWQRLTEGKILELPDASEVGCRTYIKDGVGYVVEISMNKVYRTYMYDNPKYAKCHEAKKMIRLGEIIADEFDLDEFKPTE